MGSAGVWIAGSYQSDYARNYAREGLEISDMVAEAVAGTLNDAGTAPESVEAIHVGNAFGQLFTGQGQLGAMPATVNEALWGKPAARHEAACASGSIAVLSAMADIEAGAAQGAFDGFGHHVGDLQALARVVPREVALVAAGDPRA